MGFFKKDNIEEQEEQLAEEMPVEEELVLEEERTEDTGELTAEEKRELRRKRRIRNEVLVYMASFCVLFVVAAGVFGIVSSVKRLIQDRALAEEENVSSGDSLQEIVDNILASEETLPTQAENVVSAQEQFEDYLDTIIAGMTLEEKAAGLIVTSPEQLTGVAQATRAGSGTQDALNAMPIGGLVYYRKNMESADQLKEMLSNTINYSKYPIFLAVNEGGDSASSVQNSGIGVQGVKKPEDVSSAQEAHDLGTVIGTYLSELHFNVNFAPTADVLYTGQAAVAETCFTADAAATAEYVSEFVKGLKEQHVATTLKTFPGTGHLTESTTNGMVNTDKTRAEYAENFTVFKAGIDAGADFVMVSHIVAPELSGGVDPCSMSSSVVTDILRNELGYTGIVITEPMNGKAITEYYSASEAAVAALKAGCDMILLPENLQEAYTGIIEGVQNGTIAEARINDSLKRIFRVKYADKLQDFAE